MGNHLGPFSEAPDGPEGQEQPVQAVGGQGELRGVTQLPTLKGNISSTSGHRHYVYVYIRCKPSASTCQKYPVRVWRMTNKKKCMD